MKTILSCLALTAMALSAQEPGSPVAPPTEIQSLVRSIQDQEDKVGEMRKVRDTIQKSKGIIYQGNDSKDDAPTLKEDSEDQLHEKQYADMVIKIGEIELNMDRLKYLEGEELIKDAEKMAVKDNPFLKSDSRLDPDQKLAELKRLLEKELQDANEIIRKIPLKRAIYVNVEALYKNEMERLKLMKWALSRLLEKQKE